MTRVHPVAAAGFSAAAEVYERARPTYPDEAVDWLVERAGLGPGRRVVDLAAGTGKLTRLLVPSGAKIVAVEPLAEMRALLERVLPGVETIDAIAEELPFADGAVDVVTVAQAFHWFDHARALPELHRVLRPDGGLLVLVWNTRDLDDPLQRGVEKLLAPLRERDLPQAETRWRERLDRSPLFGPVEERRFDHEQLMSADTLADRVGSTSVVAAAPSAERAALLARVRALAEGLPDPFPYRYVTEVQVAPRRD
ncbi:MAG TPA: methyltransferase domain-containing protein [Gaiellaceae bacterium]